MIVRDDAVKCVREGGEKRGARMNPLFLQWKGDQEK
jgi:hypothetical protein